MKKQNSQSISKEKQNSFFETLMQFLMSFEQKKSENETYNIAKKNNIRFDEILNEIRKIKN